MEINNIVEVKANLCPYLSHVMGRKIAPRDIMLVQKPEMEDADVVWMSPPCQPHCKIGAQAGTTDKSRWDPFY